MDSSQTTTRLPGNPPMSRLLFAALAVCLLATPVWAKGPKHKETAAEPQPALVEPGSPLPIFSGEERRILEELMRLGGKQPQATQQGNDGQGAGKKLPPGLAKKAARGQALPPGWQKKMQRGEVMDQEVYRQSTPLPREILQRLPPGPVGTTLLKVEDRVVRVMNATRAIVDVLELPR